MAEPIPNRSFKKKKSDLINWNCNTSCLQALSLAPHFESCDSLGGRSPMISPGASPLLIRRGTVPPPPLPPRRASPILGVSSNNNASCNQLMVPTEDAPPPPCCTQSLPEVQDMEADTTGIIVGDARYDIVMQGMNKLPQARHQSCPSLASSPVVNLPSKCISTPQFPSNDSSTSGESTSGPSKSGSQFAELANIIEEPSYENAVLFGGFSNVLRPTYCLTPSPSIEVPVITSTPVTPAKSPIPEKRLEAVVTVSTHPIPSRDSSTESQASSTSNHSHPLRGGGAVSPSPSPEPPSAASYENLNMDHIARLTSEGYAQDAVIRALGITRNDIAMAWDILHEFATKQTT